MVSCASPILYTLVVGLCRVNDMRTRFTAEDLEWKMLGVARSSIVVSRGASLRPGRRLRLAELVALYVPCTPAAYCLLERNTI